MSTIAGILKQKELAKLNLPNKYTTLMEQVLEVLTA